MDDLARANDDAAGRLCTACGLCCDGTFFGSVLVEPTEAARLRRFGLPVVASDGGLQMAQPCVALEGCLCRVYTDRPAACARYACDLRNAVARGDRELTDAEAAVARVHALIATIREAFECPAPGSIWERIASLEEPTTPEAAREAEARYGAAIAAVGELLELGRGSFEPRFAGGRLSVG